MRINRERANLCQRRQHTQQLRLAWKATFHADTSSESERSQNDTEQNKPKVYAADAIQPLSESGANR